MIKKLSRCFFLVAPTTSMPHEGSWYVRIKHAGKDTFVCLHQIRTVDYRRLSSRLGQIDSDDFDKVKSVVLGAVQRGGNIKAEVAPSMGSFAIENFIQRNVESKNICLMTDSSRSFERVAKGYKRLMVDHHIGEYVRGNVHVNNIESFWSHAKRSIKGTHKVVISKKYLQSYLDGFVFHYNNRHNDNARFYALMSTLLIA